MEARIDRALRERLFVADQADLGDPARTPTSFGCYPEPGRRAQEQQLDRGSLFRYDVLGSTGFLYHVRLARDGTSWSCTCPDWLRRRSPCKHVLLVWLRVLRYPRAEVCSSRFPQRALFAERCLAGTRFAERCLGARAAAAPDREGRAARALVDGGRERVVPARPLEDSDCGICCEALAGAGPWVHCETTCGNVIHADCYGMLREAARAAAPPRHRHLAPDVRCIFCRETMRGPDGAAPGRQRRMYVNGQTYVAVGEPAAAQPRGRGAAARPRGRGASALAQTMANIFG